MCFRLFDSHVTDLLIIRLLADTQLSDRVCIIGSALIRQTRASLFRNVEDANTDVEILIFLSQNEPLCVYKTIIVPDSTRSSCQG